MRKFKKISYIIMAAVLVCSAVVMGGCGKEKKKEGKSETSGDVEYKVTVKDALGKPYTSGVIAKFLLIHFGHKYFNGWGLVVLVNSLILIPYCIIQYFDISFLINSKCPTNRI